MTNEQVYKLLLDEANTELMFLENELKKWREAKAAMSKLDALIRETSVPLTGEAYKFNRSDAYPEGEFA